MESPFQLKGVRQAEVLPKGADRVHRAALSPNIMHEFCRCSKIIKPNWFQLAVPKEPMENKIKLHIFSGSFGLSSGGVAPEEAAAASAASTEEAGA